MNKGLFGDLVGEVDPNRNEKVIERRCNRIGQLIRNLGSDNEKSFKELLTAYCIRHAGTRSSSESYILEVVTNDDLSKPTVTIHKTQPIYSTDKRKKLQGKDLIMGSN